MWKLTYPIASPLPTKPSGFAETLNVQRLIDIEKKLSEGKWRDYEKWVTIYNLKQMATLNAY